MTTNTPDSGAATGLPLLQDIHFDAMIIHALITVSKPPIKRLTDDIERVA